MTKPLSKSIRDSLEFYGWKLYEGSNPMYVGAYIKDEIVLTIVPATRMAHMFHVALLTPTLSNNRFVHQTVLLDIIQGEADKGDKA